LAEDQRYLVGLGPLDRAKGFREAIWAFDILRIVVEDLHLLFIGAGPDEARLRRFSGITGTTDRVHFLKGLKETHSIVEQAVVVWIPSLTDRGLNAALEAMAAGRPVVASRWPSLAEVILDGRTGVLVPPREPGALARETRLLLDNPERCRELGDSGRQRVAAQFSVDELVRRHRAVYDQTE
jgi:glycosyltransferase involved in cell wall biosynthesis